MRHYLTAIFFFTVIINAQNYRFNPTCFRGDDRLHALRIGITADAGFFNSGGSIAEIEFAIAVASDIFRRQLNVRLEIAEIRTNYTDNTALFHLGLACPTSLSAILDLATATHANLTSHALWHHMTACRSKNNEGARGVAYVGTVCQKRLNSGVTSRSPSTWRTLIHEIGHGLGATHSYENGIGLTGGIMDTGNGFIKNTAVYGFDILKRAQVCGVLNRSSCLIEVSTPPRCGNRILEDDEECECLVMPCTGCVACKLTNKKQQCSSSDFITQQKQKQKNYDPQCCKSGSFALAGTPCNGGVCSLGRCINPCAFSICGGYRTCRVRCQLGGVCSTGENLDDGAACAKSRQCKSGKCI
jgi:hypothetical protein